MIGQLLAGHYRVVQVLGVGGFGQTYITEDLHLPGHPKCVLKHLKPASADRTVLDMARKFFEKEAIVLQQLGNHDRIPRLLAYFEEGQEFYLVQEYIVGHPLSTELAPGSKWNERQVRELLVEILDILAFIHSQGVIHRDLKPDNIMRRDNDGRLVLIDFGAIKQVRNQQALQGQKTMTVAIGTPGYMPLEQASGAPRASSDIYSLGAIAIQALTGIAPYELPVDDGTGELRWEHLTLADPHLVAIVQKMTRYHFKDRYHTADEALRAVAALISGVTPIPNTYVQTPPQPTQPPRGQNLSQMETVVVGGGRSADPTIAPSPPNRRDRPAPRRSLFPLLAGVAIISAAIGSFALFSGRLANQRNFEADLNSDACRIAQPTDLAVTRVRSQPQRDAQVQTTLPRGTKVVYLEDKDAFVKILMKNGTTGWVFNNQIADCKTPIATPKPTPTATPTIAPIKPPPKVERTIAPTPTTTPAVTPNPSESPTEIPVPTPGATATPTLSPVPTPTMTYPPRSRPTPTPAGSPVTPAPTPTIDPIPTPTSTPTSSPPPTTKPANGDTTPLF